MAIGGWSEAELEGGEDGAGTDGEDVLRTRQSAVGDIPVVPTVEDVVGS